MIDDNIESWHILFPGTNDSRLLLNEGFIERYGYRFVWNNRDFENFDDFFENFYFKTRKNIKKGARGNKTIRYNIFNQGG